MQISKRAWVSGIAAQGFSSFANFLLGFILVRLIEPAQFGEYGVAFGLALLCVAMSGALLVTPAIVIAAEYEGLARRQFLFSIFLGCVGLAAAILTVAIVIGQLAWLDGRLIAGTASLSAGLVCGVGMLAREYFVRVAFVESADHIAALINFVFMLTLFGLLAMVSRNTGFSGTQALYVYTGASITAALAGAILLRHGWLAAYFSPLDHWRAVASHGRWAMGGVVVTWLHSQGYMYIVAALIGLAAVGHINTARLIVAPLLFLQTGMQQVIMPRVSVNWADNRARGLKQARQLMLSMLVVIALSGAAFLLLGESIVTLLTARFDKELYFLGLGWLSWMVVLAVRSNNHVLLQCSREFSYSTKALTTGMVVSLLACYWLVIQVGTYGAIIALTIGEIVMVMTTHRKTESLWRR